LTVGNSDVEKRAQHQNRASGELVTGISFGLTRRLLFLISTMVTGRFREKVTQNVALSIFLGEMYTYLFTSKTSPKILGYFYNFRNVPKVNDPLHKRRKFAQSGHPVSRLFCCFPEVRRCLAPQQKLIL
jgi:hypothetical protein